MLKFAKKCHWFILKGHWYVPDTLYILKFPTHYKCVAKKLDFFAKSVILWYIYNKSPFFVKETKFCHDIELDRTN